MLKAVVIGGYKKSGKTEAIEGLVSELVRRGHRVGTVKHVSLEGFTLDQPKTDTWRHAQSGSERVVSVSPGEVATLEKRGADLSKILPDFGGLDFVIVEGFRKTENVVKIMAAQDGDEAAELDDEFTVGFIGHGVKGKPVLSRGDVHALADLVEQKAISPVGGLDCDECGYSSCRDFVLAALAGKARKDGCRALHGGVKLTVDGRQVPLKSFMQDLITGTIVGMLSSLKGAEGHEIKIEVRRHEG